MQKFSFKSPVLILAPPVLCLQFARSYPQKFMKKTVSIFHNFALSMKQTLLLSVNVLQRNKAGNSTLHLDEM